MDKDRVNEKLENYQKALTKLNLVIDDKLDIEYKTDAIIKRFEYTFELAWKLLKVYLEYKGIIAKTPRDSLREAFAAGIIKEGEIWMDMLEDRNTTSHTYKEKDAEDISLRIKERYLTELKRLMVIIEGDIS